MITHELNDVPDSNAQRLIGAGYMNNAKSGAGYAMHSKEKWHHNIHNFFMKAKLINWEGK